MTEPFLSRWAKRKQAAKTPILAESKPPPAPAAAESPPSPPPPLPDLPDIASLGPDSDYGAFLQDGVPADLRAQALTKLWASDPGLMAPEIMDLHMHDYGEPALAEAVKTAWRFGKGVIDAADLAAEAEDEAAATPPPPPKV